MSLVMSPAFIHHALEDALKFRMFFPDAKQGDALRFDKQRLTCGNDCSACVDFLQLPREFFEFVEFF